MKYFILTASVLFVFTGCKSKQSLKEKQQELKMGKLNEKNIYTASEIGWTAQIPENWEIMTKRENEKMNEKGKKVIEESTGNKLDISDLVELISLKKDAFNSILSTIEPYNEEKDGSYAEHNKMVNDIVKQAYESKKIYAVYEEGTTEADGLAFDIFTSKIYAPDKTTLIITQKIFSRLINGYDFGITINYNNENDKQTLMDIIHSSKFSIRK